MAQTPYVAAVIGGSGSGKSTIIRLLLEKLATHGDPGEPFAQVLSGDHYYHDLSHLTEAQRRDHNYDHPDSIEWSLMFAHLQKLRLGKEIHHPIYDFKTHTRSGLKAFKPSPLIIIDSMMGTHDVNMRSAIDYVVYVDVAADLRFIRRLRRDIKERGRDTEGVIQQYLNTVRPMHMLYIEPLKSTADRIIDWTEYDLAAVEDLAIFLRSEKIS